MYKIKPIVEQKDDLRKILLKFDGTGINVCEHHIISNTHLDHYILIKVKDRNVDFLYWDGVDYIYENVNIQEFLDNHVRYKTKLKWGVA